MCEAALPWIEQDKEINYIPKYIAEKYFNKYLFYKKPTRCLTKKNIPFKMSDKGTESVVIGLLERPFFNLSNEEYNKILKAIKENKEKFWDILNNRIHF